jgi:hypothetical protein
MAVNLHTKYSKQLTAAFHKPSFLTGKVNDTFSWLGNKTIRVPHIVTQAMGDYTRTGTARYGTPTELQDTYQELALSQDKSFSIVIDKGNNMEQDMMKNAGSVMQKQLRERAVPTADKYALAQWIKYAGTVKGVTKPDKTTIITAVLDGLQALDDAMVPEEGRVVWATAEMCKFIAQSTEYIALEKLGEKSISKGEIGTIMGATVVKVPSSYLPTNCYFLITYKDAVLHPKTIDESKIHQDPPGISGALLEGRVRYDAFVLGEYALGVYACVLSTAVQATPTVTDTTGSFTIASSGADVIKYTTDGSDPRYSPTAETYSAEVTKAGPYTVKAVAFDGTNFTSAVAEQAIAE